MNTDAGLMSCVVASRTIPTGRVRVAGGKMARTATERAMNIPGHAYSYWEPGRVHICQICGTAEHKNGEYWWAGRWSLVEPPCGHTSTEQKIWFNMANPDPEFPELPDMVVSNGSH